MKKTSVLIVIALFMGGVAWSQNTRRVSEQDVDAKYVQDFQHMAKGATNVTWYSNGDKTFRADFTDKEGDRESLLFSPKGTENHYHIPSSCYPAFILDTLANMPEFKDYTIDRLYARKAKGAMTYQVRVTKKKGILWWKRETAPKLVNFETTGKFIDAIDE